MNPACSVCSIRAVYVPGNAAYVPNSDAYMLSNASNIRLMLLINCCSPVLWNEESSRKHLPTRLEQTCNVPFIAKLQ